MKNLYDYLNYVSTTEEFSPEPLTKEERDMIKKAVSGNKRIKVRRIGVIAAAAALITAVGITSYATGFIDNIIKTVTTGHNQFTVYSSSPVRDGVDMPSELRGLLYNADGSEADRFFPNAEYYDENGKKIDDLTVFIRSEGIGKLTTDDGTIAVAFDGMQDDSLSPIERFKKQSDNARVVYSLDELNGKLDFTPAVPSSLPDGFSFAGAGYYQESGLYLTLYYKNSRDEYFMIFERVINDETAYESGAMELEELNVNNYNAVLQDGRSLDWEADGVSISISGRGYLDKDELLSIANSIYE